MGDESAAASEEDYERFPGMLLSHNNARIRAICPNAAGQNCWVEAIDFDTNEFRWTAVCAKDKNRKQQEMHRAVYIHSHFELVKCVTKQVFLLTFRRFAARR